MAPEQRERPALGRQVHPGGPSRRGLARNSPNGKRAQPHGIGAAGIQACRSRVNPPGSRLPRAVLPHHVHDAARRRARRAERVDPARHPELHALVVPEARVGKVPRARRSAARQAGWPSARRPTHARAPSGSLDSPELPLGTGTGRRPRGAGRRARPPRRCTVPRGSNARAARAAAGTGRAPFERGGIRTSARRWTTAVHPQPEHVRRDTRRRGAGPGHRSRQHRTARDDLERLARRAPGARTARGSRFA